eukprot:4034476-Pleurochrysis_carterae.AAC.1
MSSKCEESVPTPHTPRCCDAGTLSGRPDAPRTHLLISNKLSLPRSYEEAPGNSRACAVCDS